MKKRCAGLCIALAVSWVGGTASAEWLNTLQPKGKAQGQLTVVEAGAPRAVIRLSARPTSEEQKAAADLQYWIREMTAATLEISSAKSPGPSIVLRTRSSLGDEGYSIALSHDRLTLSGGTTRGIINAVYALLEEDLGCRFYTQDSIRLPRTNTLVLAPVQRRYLPPLRLRDPYYACAFDPVWSLRNRSNAPDAAVPEAEGGHISYDGMFVHTAGQIVPEDKYFKDHPEYFARREDGTHSTAQLCPTHPDVAKLAIAYVRQVLQDHPEVKILSVSKNDNGEVCHCPKCTKLRDAEGSDMANQLYLVHQVAEAIEREHPGVLIDTLAYGKTIHVPKTMRPRRNVAIRLCNDKVGSWAHPFTLAEKCDVGKLAAEWHATRCHLYIWDYTINFSHYLAPMPNLDVMAANVRFWIKNGAEGVMLQGGYQGPAERDELKCWVTSKIMWDPSRDEKALARDFIRGHYGNAAPALEEYEALLDQLETEHAAELATPTRGIRYPMDSPFFTEQFVKQATAIFARAKELAGGDDTLTRRVERAELPILYLECVRGPEFVGANYAQVVEDFERIARRENVQRLREGGPDFETKLATYKAHLSKPALGH
jgi:Domain of unknown function (DUF4838)